jgi:hypothetical protein
MLVAKAEREVLVKSLRKHIGAARMGAHSEAGVMPDCLLSKPARKWRRAFRAFTK